MASRRRRQQNRQPRALGGVAGPQHTEERAGGVWAVRPMPGHSTTKPYRCPFCEDVIPRGTPHVVVWPTDESAGLEQRRHWHTRCWKVYR